MSRRPITAMKTMAAAVALTATLGAAGCSTASSAYYGTLERFGIEKRDILVDRVEDASKAQADAKEDFSSALDAFRNVVNVEGGDMEKAYDRLNRRYYTAENQALEVRERIEDMKGVARDLFREWRIELDEYSDPGLRRISEDQLNTTEARYVTLARKMDDASASMDPVLSVFKDRVLFLKHNLNARAIAALGPESETIESDVATLIAEMEQSIAEAEAFIADMRSEA
ncbi:MAG: DUF2959 domain-containing protein [Pseudomonadota bacterium]